MQVTVEMASSINGLIAYENGSEDFLLERNYQIMLDFLKNYDCLVWGNTTFKNVMSWGSDYINDLKYVTVIVFSKSDVKYPYDNVIVVNSMEHFYKVCEEKNINKVFVSGGARTNTMFMKEDIVNEVIINYNPYVLNKGINLFEGDFFEKKLVLDKVVREQEDILQVWYKVLNSDSCDSKKRVLITGSVLTADNSSVETYEKLVSLIDTDKYFISSPLDTMKFQGNDLERYERAMNLLKDTKYIIAEMSTVSTGQGMELQEAVNLNIPVLVIAKKGSKISGLVRGCQNLVDIIFYDNIDDISDEILKFVS